MKRKRFTEEQIIRILLDAETTTIEGTAQQQGGVEQSLYRWKRQFGHMQVVDVGGGGE